MKESADREAEYTKDQTPSNGKRGTNASKRSLVLTKVVLEQENTAATLSAALMTFRRDTRGLERSSHGVLYVSW